MKTRLIYSMVLAALVPMTLNAQNATGQSNSNANTNANSQTRIDAAIQTAAKAHIPASLLQSKVREGEAKHVPQQRIAAAVEARLEALMDAQEAMQSAKIQGTSDSELAVAADAIQAGVSGNALVKVYRNSPSERRVVAVAVLADLVRLGQSSDQALARVSGAVSSNVALANLQAEVASQLRLGGLSSTLDATGIVKIQ
ncbi:MAG TPA: hypothetical protein VM100_10305 [Longimicrobiales bacterium]|nr:hypothetical protein [Longimicrobiales bacterium]